MSSINFDNAYLLLLALPLALLFAVPFFLCVRKDNVNGHNIASAVIHLGLALLIAFAAAGSKIVTYITETNVYVLADVSYSSEKNLELIDSYIENLNANLPKNSKLGVVCFGRDYKITTHLGQPIQSVKNSGVDGSATDIAKALTYAGTIFRNDVIKRVVLITDGVQTAPADDNALKRAVDTLSALKIHVDAIYLNNALTEGTGEVQVSRVEYNKTAYLNHTESVTATINSNTVSQGVVSLYCEGELIGEKAVGLVSGANSVSFPLNTAESGTYRYEVRVAAEGDYNPHNNSGVFTQEVTGNVNILLIAGTQADVTAVENAYRGMAQIESYVGTYKVPCSVEAMLRYDEIILSDIDVSLFENRVQFEESLNTAVSMFGKSLITFGNVGLQNSSAVSGINNMLPVRYGNSAESSSLYTIVIDASRSMLTLDKLTYAKEAALGLIDILDENDDLAVVFFYGDVSELSYLQPVHLSDKQKVEEVKESIRTLGGTQGTYIGLALNAALAAIKSLSYSNKQVMLISDGLNYENETHEPLSVVREMLANSIVTSVFDVGRGADTGVAATTAKALLQNIASQGAGIYYEPPTSEEDVKKVVFGAMADNTKEVLVSHNSYVNIARKYDEVLSGISDVSYLGGYVNASTKAAATTVLTTNYVSANGAKTTVPVYAYWKYGNGRVATFTSTLSGEWIAPWSREGLDSAFFRNLLYTNLPAGQTDYPFLIESFSSAGKTRLEITPATLNPEGEATIRITAPYGEEENKMTFLVSSYAYTFETDEAGDYGIEITYSYGGYSYTADASFTLSYLAEYDSFTLCDAGVLHKIVGGKGTVSENGVLVIENNENEVGTRTVYLTVPLLLIAALLFLADIIIRKLKWADVKNLFIKIDKTEKGGKA